MRPVEAIRRKRDGEALAAGDIRAFVEGVTAGRWSDAQAAAMLMAIVLRGMSDEETAALVVAMADSGTRLAWPAADARPCDKHSTGGVGDKTSFVVAPVVAACGGRVPMMSGRGLGHTGGTLDKLEAIPGLTTGLSTRAFLDVVERVGCAIVGQTEEIAPADRRLYALRDVTATVESVPLICASILSKKIAEGALALVLDVKCGRGAFMATDDEARGLAAALVRHGAAAGLAVEAVVSDMDAPLGAACGNALEVAEALDVLGGGGPDDVRHLSLLLAARMLLLSGAAAGEETAMAMAVEALDGGRARERFAAMVAAQGGDARVVDDPHRLPRAPECLMLVSPRAGVVSTVDARAVGEAVVVLGAGRQRAGDPVDPAVGVRVLVKPGDRVERGTPLAEVHARGAAAAQRAEAALTAAMRIGDEAPATRPLVHAVITTPDGVTSGEVP